MRPKERTAAPARSKLCMLQVVSKRKQANHRTLKEMWSAKVQANIGVTISGWRAGGYTVELGGDGDVSESSEQFVLWCLWKLRLQQLQPKVFLFLLLFLRTKNCRTLATGIFVEKLMKILFTVRVCHQFW